MVEGFLTVLVALAFLSGPSAFLLLWLVWRRDRTPGLGSLGLSLTGLFLILVGNTVSLLSGRFGGWWDPRWAYLNLIAVFLATVLMGAFLARFAHQVTGVPLGRRRVVFWVTTLGFLFLVQAVPLFRAGPGSLSLEDGYLGATVYGTLCTAYAAGLVVRHRARVPQLFGGAYPWYFLGLAGLSVVSVLNDVFHFGRWFAGPDVPFSPLFFLLVNGSVVVVCVRALLSPTQGPSAGAPDFGYTDRERELVPLLLEGLSNDEIGARLFISAHTVKNHITSIYRKAGVSNRHELMRKCLPVTPAP